MIRARLRIRLPDGLWVAELSRQFPDAAFELLAGYYGGDTAVELGEVVTDEPGAVVDALRSHPGVDEFELLESEERRVLGTYETADAGLYEFVERSSLPLEFPVTARNGWFEFDLTGTREDLDRLRERIEASGGTYELQSVVQTTESESLLTDRQRELLEAAVREGYYEVPRECTLAELAHRVGVDKSTASTVLRRGEATLVEWFLSGPATRERSVR